MAHGCFGYSAYISLLSRERVCRGDEAMARCVKLVMFDGMVIPFAPQAALPCARDADGILGSLGLDVGFIFYTTFNTDNGHPVESSYKICGHIQATFFSQMYFVFYDPLLSRIKYRHRVLLVSLLRDRDSDWKFLMIFTDGLT